MSDANSTARVERIMVADDERGVAHRIQKYLQGLGHDVTCVYDGRQALELLEHTDFDRVFLDVMMPYVDGFEVHNWIRRHPTKKKTLVALMTAQAESAPYDPLEGAIDHYVLKPIVLDDLWW